MRVNIDLLWVIEGPEGFGISRATLSLAKQFRDHGKSIRFVSISRGSLHDLLLYDGFEVICLEMSKREFYRKDLIFFLQNSFNVIHHVMLVKRKIQQAVANLDFSILMYRSPNLTPIVSTLSVRKVTKIWLMAMDISNSYPLSLNKRLYQIFVKTGNINVVGNSRFTASTIAGFGIEPSVLYLGVDRKRFSPNNSQSVTRDDLGFLKDDIVFGVFARFHPTKAQDLIIRSFFSIRSKYPTVKLLFIGGDIKNGFYKECKDLIDSLNLEDAILVLETVEDIEKYYSVVDVMINSRRDAEPFGLTVVESMLMEKPVIALAKGGPAETVVHNDTGWLVTQATVEGYTEAMLMALREQEKWITIGSRARERALEMFTSEVMYRNLEKLINDFKNGDN